MNLFRSEEHVLNWALNDPASADGTMPLKDYATLFSGRLFRERLSPDYLLHVQEMVGEWMGALAKLGKGSFWQLGSS